MTVPLQSCKKSGELGPLSDPLADPLDEQALTSFLDLMIDLVVETLRAERVSILLQDPYSEMLSIEASLGLPADLPPGAEVHPGEGLAGFVLREQIPVLIRQGQKPSYLHVPLTQPDLIASVVIPICHDDQALGAICAGTTDRAERFTQRNLDWLVEIANRLSPVLVALKSQKTHQGTVRHMFNLLRVLDRLGREMDENRAVDLVLESASKLCSSEACFFAPAPPGAPGFNLSSRHQRCNVCWSPGELEYFERLGREAMDQRKEIDLVPAYRSPMLVRRSLAERDIERVMVFPVTAEEISYGALYAFPKRYDGKPVRLLRILASHLATALAQMEHLKQLENLAFVDELTQTYNRNYWMERYQEEWARAKRNGHPLSIILFDLDDFKACNDRYGHSVGDQLLACAGRMICRTARNFDNVCRFGGEEFTVLLPGVQRQQAVTIADRIRRAIEEMKPFKLGQGPQRLTLSGGVATYPEDAADRDELLKAADAAMYRAKHQGKNRICTAASREPQVV